LYKRGFAQKRKIGRHADVGNEQVDHELLRKGFLKVRKRYR
jgi:hypothetical protein